MCPVQASEPRCDTCGLPLGPCTSQRMVLPCSKLFPEEATGALPQAPTATRWRGLALGELLAEPRLPLSDHLSIIGEYGELGTWTMMLECYLCKHCRKTQNILESRQETP